VAHIVLVGMMGSGKTTVGAELARRRQWDFVDSDAQVEARAGRTVAAIWAAEGEDGFRTLESAALAEAVASARPSVIAAAGGTVLDPGNRRLLARHRPVVWLRAAPDTLSARLGDGAGRPLLSSDPAGALEALAAIRYPLYEDVADVVVDVDRLDPVEVADAIETAVGGDAGQRP
jgi:shikimate kinase